ncbi:MULTISPECIES: flavin reductase family protein [Pontibacillus]|uniref:Flavin reductase family protein n=1 Tax=Pontibacillus chungwhensis TaxID=265426 RepID=A0ABY8V6G6_9BACI|nr:MULTISPECIES: flavin reductase family protein [Pontibacillus]MCD5322151.1 flavin reductase family protein [Pontibacillus sp. HN14]WIF99446.1 flavin reductase family protein [Pontibacillus chungwhensis]
MDDRMFKTAMSKFATGVTVVTTETDNEVRGMTANAFMSVSMEPKLIAVSVAKKARMHEYIKESGQFVVNILSNEQEDMSNYFAGMVKEKWELTFDRFEEQPAIKDSIVNIACSLYGSHEAGDHTIYIGEVKNLSVKDGVPLGYYQGKYCKISE